MLYKIVPRIYPAACCAVPSGGIVQLRVKYVLYCLLGVYMGRFWSNFFRGPSGGPPRCILPHSAPRFLFYGPLLPSRNIKFTMGTSARLPSLRSHGAQGPTLNHGGWCIIQYVCINCNWKCMAQVAITNSTSWALGLSHTYLFL